MTEKQFKPVFSGRYNDVFIGVKDNKEDELLMTLDTIDKLNDLSKENEQLKSFKQKVFKLIDDNIQIYEDTTTNDDFLQIQLDTKLQTFYNLRKELQEWMNVVLTVDISQ